MTINPTNCIRKRAANYTPSGNNYSFAYSRTQSTLELVFSPRFRTFYPSSPRSFPVITRTFKYTYIYSSLYVHLCAHARDLSLSVSYKRPATRSRRTCAYSIWNIQRPVARPRAPINRAGGALACTRARGDALPSNKTNERSRNIPKSSLLPSSLRPVLSIYLSPTRAARILRPSGAVWCLCLSFSPRSHRHSSSVFLRIDSRALSDRKSVLLQSWQKEGIGETSV